ncbi:DNA-binding protein [gut metagenome]|uniref:DNA-binding protein n=1 Tax=gut metagenome TaxID=749906 RepID=J9FH01_9ZZZZ
MAAHNTPYSSGVIKGVITDMVGCIKHLILDGKNVKLDNLAIFSCGILPLKGAATPEEFRVVTHVKGVRLRARATGDLTTRRLNLEATLREVSRYALPDGEGEDNPEGPTADKQPGKDPEPVKKPETEEKVPEKKPGKKPEPVKEPETEEKEPVKKPEETGKDGNGDGDGDGDGDEGNF